MRSIIVGLRYLLAAALLALLFTACAAEATDTTPVPPTEPSAPSTPTEAVQQEATVIPTEGGEAAYSLDLGDLARRAVDETVPAVQPSVEAAWWTVMPQHERLTLEGYPISEHLLQPQIFIYPAEDLPGWNEEAGKQLDDLQALLSSQRVGEHLPFLPLNNAAQAMHAQVKFIDIKNGEGVRFLTQYNQGLVPVNNRQLFYTFQGLTSDGSYYVAAVLPVSFPEMPDDELTPLPTTDPFWSDYPGYLAETVEMLDEASDDEFTPDLSQLDALIMSLEVR